jgi:hypothetical protein
MRKKKLNAWILQANPELRSIGDLYISLPFFVDVYHDR